MIAFSATPASAQLDRLFRSPQSGSSSLSDAKIGDGLKEGEEVVTGSYKTLRTLKDQAKIKTEVKKARS